MRARTVRVIVIKHIVNTLYTATTAAQQLSSCASAAAVLESERNRMLALLQLEADSRVLRSRLEDAGAARQFIVYTRLFF